MTLQQPFCKICSSLNLWLTISAIHTLYQKKLEAAHDFYMLLLPRLWFSNSFQRCLCPPLLKAELQNRPELKHGFESLAERIGPDAKTGRDVRLCQYVFRQHTSGDTEYLYPRSRCAEGKYSDTMGCAFHHRKATACLWEVSVAERLRHRRPLAPDTTQLLPARGWTPGAELTLSRRTGCPAPPHNTRSTSSGKNTSREKVLKAFVVSAELPLYAALRDLHS